MMTVLARSMDVKLGLVTHCTGSEVVMAAPSLDQTYYEPGDRMSLEPGLLCEYVVSHRAELMVADARSEAEWVDNPDARIGLLAYLGLPLYWPDGDVFGTICVLNDSPHDFSQADRRLLLSARDAIHDALGAAGAATPLPDVEPGTAGEPTGLWDYDPAEDRLRLSVSIRRRYDLADGDTWTLAQWLRCFPEDQRTPIVAGLDAIREGRAQSMSVAALVPGPESKALVRLTARGIRYEADQVIAIVGSHTASSAVSSTTPELPFARDPLTGLPTRAELEYRVQRSLEWHGRRGAGAQVVMAIVEVTNVGSLVRSEGIEPVDSLMMGLADRLRGADRFVAALGFGYFAVLVNATAAAPSTAAEHLATALRADVATLSSTGPAAHSIAIATVDVVQIAARATGPLLSEVTRGLLHEAPAPAADVRGPVAPALTTRQREIAMLVAQGLSNREIAEALVITVRTVEGHLDGIRDKLGVTSRTQLVALVLTHPGMVEGARSGGLAGRA